jgi:hypothetical protein
MVGEKRALPLQEMRQVRHLLKIRRYVRVVAAQMDIVELNVDDVLDAVTI